MTNTHPVPNKKDALKVYELILIDALTLTSSTYTNQEKLYTLTRKRMPSATSDTHLSLDPLCRASEGDCNNCPMVGHWNLDTSDTNYSYNSHCLNEKSPLYHIMNNSPISDHYFRVLLKEVQEVLSLHGVTPTKLMPVRVAKKRVSLLDRLTSFIRGAIPAPAPVMKPLPELVKESVSSTVKPFVYKGSSVEDTSMEEYSYASVFMGGNLSIVTYVKEHELSRELLLAMIASSIGAPHISHSKRIMINKPVVDSIVKSALEHNTVSVSEFMCLYTPKHPRFAPRKFRCSPEKLLQLLEE